jgi:hypothetical protein
MKAMTKRQLTGVFVLALLMLARCVSAAQEEPMKVKGGHQLGETAEQFFAEGDEKQVLSACSARDFKKLNKTVQHHARQYCDDIAETRKQAIDGMRKDYHSGDLTEVRKDTFTFDGGHLVKVELVYSIPSAEFNYRGLSFAEIFGGVKQAYGPPTSESTKPVQDSYGVPYVTHREVWIAAHSAILITEQPGSGGSTTLAAFTREEYEHSMAGGEPKPANPLQ